MAMGGTRISQLIALDHIGSLDLEVRVVGRQMPLQAMQLQPVLAPDALHGRKRDVAQLGCKLATAPDWV